MNLKFSILTGLLLSIHLFSFSMNTDALEAFSKSYEQEAYLKYEDAISTMLSVYDENSYSINLRLGWLTYLNGDYMKSLNYYKKAVELQPRSIEAKLGLVYPLAAMENWDDVIIQYNKILSIEPTNSTANYRLGYIYYYRKDFKKAAGYINKVLEIYPFDYNSNALMGSIQVGLGDINQAKVYYKQALYYNPTEQTIIEELDKLK